MRSCARAAKTSWARELAQDRIIPATEASRVSPDSSLAPDWLMALRMARTVSRLNEMQSTEFLAQERRIVDTRLT